MKPIGRPPKLPLADAVKTAIAAVQHQLELVRLDFPTLTPRQHEQIAKSRCNDLIAAANVAIDLQAAKQRRLAPRLGPDTL
jgi:hypothetical protein